MTLDAPGPRFAVRLSDLERDTHVPWEDLRTEAGEAPSDPPITQYELETTRLLHSAAMG